MLYRGMPIPTATWAAGKFISAIHSVTGCSTWKDASQKQKTLEAQKNANANPYIGSLE